MSATKYSYSIQGAFPNHKVASDRLLSEIRVSAIVTAADYINTSGDDCDVWFKDSLSGGDEIVLGGLVAVHSGESLPSEATDVHLVGTAEDEDNRLRVSQEPRREGDGLVFVTHNWCDPTTWYSQSVRVYAEVMTDSGDGLTFNSVNDNWIDLTHGKIYRENLIAAPYLPVVTVDGYIKTERASWAESGGDFSINYATGKVTFFASQAGKTVLVAYSRENGSLFIVAPTAGKKLWVEYSEVQFAVDVELKSDIHFQPWAYNPSDPPNKIPVSSLTTYRTLDNFVEEANGCYPIIPAMGGARGFSKDRVTFPFKYQTVKELRSDWGLEIRIWVEGDVPFDGQYGTATFYCTSYDE